MNRNRRFDRRKFHERRVSRFSMTDLMQQGIFVEDSVGREWINNDNGYFTLQAFPEASQVVILSLSEIYHRARIVLDGHRQVIARRRRSEDRLDRIQFIPK
jgi:hypothetical protein